MSEITDETKSPQGADYVSVETFDELPLSEPVRRAIREKGYLTPTPVQAQSLRPVLSGRDVMVRSKTGTGKTAAFGIPLVEIADTGLGAVQAVALCNTRELAQQVAHELESLGVHKGVQVAAIYGGASMDEQVRKLKGGAQIVVGTPGRVIDLIERRLLDLSAVKTVVLDEADEMLSAGFVDAVRTILRSCPKGHQTLLFSATLPPDLDELIRSHMKDPETILLSGDVYTVEGIRHVRYYAQDAYPKPRNLLYMLQLENPETAIVFCNTRDDVNLVTTVLNKNGFDADKLSGELAQSERERVMAKIKRGEVRFMVATDLAARGIDITDLTHVINYSLPEDPAVYLHRAGRTGRIGKNGTALSLVRGTELVTLSALEKKYGITFEERQMPSPEEAKKMWSERHLSTLKEELGSELFDAYIPLAQELKERPGGDVFIAFLLKYFFRHHRLEKAAAPRREEELRVVKEKDGVQKERLEKRRGERSRPKLESGEKPVRERRRREERSEEAPATEATPKPVRERRRREVSEETPAGAEPETDVAEAEVKPNRLFVSLGTSAGYDEAKVRETLSALSGADAADIESVEMLPSHAYVEVKLESVQAFLAGHEKPLDDKTLTVELARPKARRRRRRRSPRGESNGSNES